MSKYAFPFLLGRSVGWFRASEGLMGGDVEACGNAPDSVVQMCEA